MRSLIIYAPIPIAFLLLLVFTKKLWALVNLKDKVDEGTKDHNDRIYRDFEFFVRIFLVLGAGLGFVRLQSSADLPLQRQAMIGIAAVGMVVMLTLAVFIACHQASKIQRWKKVRWEEWWHWQEIWMMLAMFVLSSGLWIVAWIW